jgi:tetratricopeptide (TPR) repeat protein
MNFFRKKEKIPTNLSDNEVERTPKAVKSNNQPLELDSHESGSWSDKAGVLNNSGRFEEAIKCCNKALELNPQNGDAWYNKGSSLAPLGRYGEAIKCYDKALELNSQDYQAWSNKAASLNKLGRFEEAIECCNRVLEFNSQDTIALQNKAIAEEGRAQKNWHSRKNVNWKFFKCYSCGEDLKIVESERCQNAVCSHCGSEIKIHFTSSHVDSKDSATELNSYLISYSTLLDEERFFSYEQKCQILGQIIDDVFVRFRYYFSVKAKALVSKTNSSVALVFETNCISSKSASLMKEFLAFKFKSYESKNAGPRFEEQLR